MTEPSFWERPDVVERFGAREPDRRLVALVERRGAERLRTLDVGCAAGRNSRFLAAAGAEVWALDGSGAMVDAARAQLAELLGAEEAERRVLHGRMDDLSAFADASFDLLLALGAFQNAVTDDEWERTLGEAARVLAPGGLCLVANFSPDSQPHGAPLERVPDEPHVFQGFGGPHRRISLLTAAELDASFARHGLLPAEPTAEVRVDTERGYRTTVNALYRKQGR